MKKNIYRAAFLTLIMTLVLGLTEQASAQLRTNTEAGVRARVNVSTGTSSTSTKERILEKRAERKDAVREGAEQRISRHIDFMVKRFNAMIERLEKLTTRIESRIAKIKAEGTATAEAEAYVATAKLEIKSAKDGVAKIPQALTLALEKERLLGSFDEVRVLTAGIKEDLKSAHQALVKSITNIKGLRTEMKVEGEANVRVESVQ